MMLVLMSTLASAAHASPLTMGEMRVRSKPDQPLVATIPINGANASVNVRVRDLEARPIPLRIRLDPRDDGAGTRLRITSPVPLPDDARLRVQISLGGTVFAATFRLDPAVRGAFPLASMDHVYAGQITTGASLDGWYGLRETQTYGPTRPNEDLRQIAAALSRQIPEPRDKIEVALYRRNPTRFIDHDPRRLKPRSILKVPSTVDVHLVPAAQAQHLDRYLTGRAASPFIAAASAPKPKSGIIADLLAARTFLGGWWPWLLGAAVLCLGYPVLRRRMTVPPDRWWRQRNRRSERLRGEERQRQHTLGRIERNHVMRLEQLVAQYPDVVPYRVRLAKSYLAVGDQGAYLRCAAALRGQVSAAQWRQFRKLALEAGIRTPIFS